MRWLRTDSEWQQRPWRGAKMAEARLIPALYPLLPHISPENLISRPSPSLPPSSISFVYAPASCSPPSHVPSPHALARRRRAQRAALPLRHEGGRLDAWDRGEGRRRGTGPGPRWPVLDPACVHPGASRHSALSQQIPLRSLPRPPPPPAALCTPAAGCYHSSRSAP